MCEKSSVVKDLNVEFEGVFSMKGLYKLIDDYFDRLGYDKKEKKTFEAQKKDGKYMEIELEYSFKLNDYTKAIHEVKLKGTGLRQVDIKRGDRKVRMNKGKLKVSTGAKIETDTSSKWEGKPVYYFLRTLWNKYVWSNMSKSFEKEIKGTANHLVAEVKAYLNLGKY